MEETMIPDGAGRHPPSDYPFWTFLTALSGISDPRERARLVATGLPSLLSCRLSGVALADDNGASWNLIAQLDGRQIDPPQAEQLLAELDPLYQEALRRPSLLIATIAAKTDDEQIPPVIGELGIGGLAVAPLRTLHRNLGWVFAGREGPGTFSREEELILWTLAEHSAIGFENLRLSNHLQDLVEENTEALRKSEEKHRVLLEINNAIISNLDKESLLNAIAMALRKVLPFDRVALTLLDPSTDVLKVHALTGASARKRFLTVGTEFPLKGSPLVPVFDRKRPLIRRHLEEGGRIGVEENLFQEGIRSYVAVPLMAKREPFGSLNLGSLAPDQYSEADAEFLMAVGQQVALAVENMLAYEEIAQLKSRVEQENLYLLEEIKTHHKFEEIIGRGRAIQKVLKEVETVAPTDATVLILGETGTGKELVARAVHNLSPVKNQTLVKVNCAALPAGLIESELFGHKKGAFTGAVADKIGRFELADGGTIFLDEIGDLLPDLQVKLLRVLQEGEFEKVGGSRTIRVRVRVIAATNRNLIEAMRQGTFRADLYYRLSVFPLTIPPLREREDDIPLLVRHFVRKYGARFGKKVETIPQGRMEALQAYPWPGNVRELENVIERAMILSPGPELFLADWAPGAGTAAPSLELNNIQDVEREHILKILEFTNWQVSGEKGAAKILGLNRTTLQGRMQKLGLRRET